MDAGNVLVARQWFRLRRRQRRVASSFSIPRVISLEKICFFVPKSRLGFSISFLFDRNLLDDKSKQSLPEHVIDGFNYIKKMTREPRLIKTHLPWELLPNQIRNGERKPKVWFCYVNFCCCSIINEWFRSFWWWLIDDFDCRWYMCGEIQEMWSFLLITKRNVWRLIKETLRSIARFY